MNFKKINSQTAKYVSILFLFFITCGAFAQGGTNKKQKATSSTEEKKAVVPSTAPVNAAPVLVKKLGDNKIMLEDGIKVVYDANGIPLLINADDFERIYLEEQAKKSAKTNDNNKPKAEKNK